MAGYKLWTRERLTSSELQSFLQDQVNLVFASASARDAAVTAPVEGMASFLRDGKVWEDYVGGAWRRRNGRVAAIFPNGTVTGTNNASLATVTVNPGRPYRVTVHAAINSLPTADAQGTLRLFDLTTLGTTIRTAKTIKFDGPDADVLRTFDVTGGEARTFEANLEVLAGTVQYFAAEQHSFLEATWTAL